jgi:hypothetical protein
MSPKRGQSASGVTRKLGAINRKLAEERQRERTIRSDWSAARAEVERCNQALAAHFASDDHDPEPVELYAALEAAEAKAAKGRWEPRLEGARQKIAKLESLEAKFARDNVGPLLAEIEPEAISAAESVSECFKSALDSLDRYEQIASKVSRIVSADPRMNGRIVPTLGQEGQQLRRDVKLLATNPVPVPLPSLDWEPDPTITSAGTVSDLDPSEVEGG